jgi:hypothetical protein
MLSEQRLNVLQRALQPALTIEQARSNLSGKHPLTGVAGRINERGFETPLARM